MDILHWWQLKMVAIQLLCWIGVAWSVRFLVNRRRVVAKISNPPQDGAPAQRVMPDHFAQN